MSRPDRRKLLITTTIVTLGASLALLTACPSSSDDADDVALASLVTAPEPADGLAAFDVVYDVLQHPRCLNCHPAGDRPLQTDDSRPHTMNVQRGPDDRGRPGMRCVTCHGRANLDAPHLPPGVAAEWHVAPREMLF